MRNNIIAIVLISFVTVGALWGIGNILNAPRGEDLPDVQGILLIAQNNAFNETNPEITASVNVPKKLIILNKDIVTHDLIIEDKYGRILGVNTAPLRPEQHFIAAILGYESGMFEYYCSYHPDMRGNIRVQ
jgi:plastocyanin